MDLKGDLFSYEIDEARKKYLEMLDGKLLLVTNTDLAPGEVFDTVREKASKKRLEGLNYFSKVETYAEETDVPNRQKLIVKVEEKGTGEVSFGAGFSSVELFLEQKF